MAVTKIKKDLFFICFTSAEIVQHGAENTAILGERKFKKTGNSGSVLKKLTNYPAFQIKCGIHRFSPMLRRFFMASVAVIFGLFEG